ncbi:MAG: HAMP domain-containing sensor histidine kinase [Sulfurimonas sp.]|uniref:sensor histidine kinase n=1 Tax=Sulfurimonas sp. TaxID=2022749 RepID=UPI0026303A98|nr:HAMP domain-containing sensor histidine kinase [Sulfurimonas sp.]MDD5400909.1 HAMP domain-containing sensor histidine kinase [Sulfurimonas sp.]
MQNLSKIEILENEVEFLSKKILELNKKLIDSDKAKTLFLSLIANKLNDPMTAILGMLPHLKIQNGNEKIFSTICQEASDLDFKIQNLITVAEIESGNMNNTHALLEIKKIIDEALESLKYIIKDKNIEINVENLVEKKIVTDPKKIYIITKNLISNACMHCPQNGVVDIILSTEKSILTLLIKNESSEPKLKEIPKIFTRFSEKIDSRHGLGIGLSIVRELCESLGGSVEYDIDNNFVTFKVKLPLDEAMQDFQACGSNEFLFDSFDDAIEL